MLPGSPQFQRLGPTFKELTDKQIEFAAAIKDAAPDATVLATGIALLRAWRDLLGASDFPQTGEFYDYVVYFLRAARRAEADRGHRVIDAFSFHRYAQPKGVMGDEDSPEVAAARIHNPRIYWDPNYAEDSKDARELTDIAGGPDGKTPRPLMLLPRLKQLIDREYPGTKIAITEYNFGGPSHISGGLAQADFLGILGQQGVFVATWWPMIEGHASRPWGFSYGAFDLYRDFDGKNASFGDTHIAADLAGPAADQDHTSLYASTNEADPASLFIVAINKTDRPTNARIALKHSVPLRSAAIYQLTGKSDRVQRAGTIPIPDAHTLDYTLPPYSATMLHLTAAP
jgi:mannan endo-1,4-beta-mannosidase